MKLLALFLPVLALTIAGCESKVECAAKAEIQYICAGDDGNQSYKCPAGTADQVSQNEQIDADCEALGEINAIAQCILDAQMDDKYAMVEATLDEDCAASGKTCDSESGDCSTD